MANTRYVNVWIVRIKCDTTVAKWHKWAPLHEDKIWGLYLSEEEARREIESHARWFGGRFGFKNMKNQWVSIERTADGLVRTLSWHNTHVYKGERDYTNTTYRYSIEKQLLDLKTES